MVSGQELRLVFNRSQLPYLAQLARATEKPLCGLLSKVGVAGEVRVSLIRQARGSPHTRGIKLSRPEESGVRLTVQPGGNGTRIEMKLHPPEGWDAETLYRRLRQQLIEGKNNDEVASRDLPTNFMPAVEIVGASEDKETSPEQERTSEMSLRGFVTDPDNIRLLVLEIEKIQGDTGQADLTSGQVTEALSRLVGRPVYGKGMGPIFRSLVNRGVLERFGPVGKGVYRLVRPASEPEAEVEPVPALPPLSLARDIVELEARVARWLAAQQEIDEIERELAYLEETKADLLSRLEELQTANSEARRAAEQLAQVRELLGE